MRSRSLVAVVLLAGCTQSTPPAAAPPAATSPAATPPAAVVVAAGQEQTPGEAPADEAAMDVPMTPEQRSRTWSARSENGLAEVIQVARVEGDGRGCDSRATLRPEEAQAKSEVVWRWPTCLASGAQLKFVSPDGQHLLVIEPAPALPPTGPWMGLELASLYAHGVRIRVLKAQSVWGMPRVNPKPTPHLEWLQGHGAQPGTPARYVADGTAVAFETLEGRAWTLKFSGEGFPAGSEAPASFTEREPLLRYQDARGTVHVVRSLEQVPRRFRDRVPTVTAEVDVRPSPKPPPAKVADTSSAASGPSGGKTPSGATEPASPADLLERAEQAARKVEAVRREQDRLLQTPP